MARPFVRVLVGLLASTALLLVASPLILYGVGLNAIESLPVPPVGIATEAQQANVWLRVRGHGTPQVQKLNPYSYIYSVATAAPQDPSALVAWQVAAEHLLVHRRSTGMSWWHLSGAALTIWVTRNWSSEQILSQAAIVMKQERANQSLEPTRVGKPPLAAQLQRWAA